MRPRRQETLYYYDGNRLCKYSPDQPRVPAGNPDGGQWTSEDSSDAESASKEHQIADSGEIMTDANVNNGDVLGYPNGKPVINPNTGAPYRHPRA